MHIIMTQRSFLLNTRRHLDDAFIENKPSSSITYFIPTGEKVEFPTPEITQMTLVIGNESCDLDSAVSTVVLAGFLCWVDMLKVCENQLFVPILDVDRQDYRLKTEIAYAFGDVGLSEDYLIFRDDYDFQRLIKKWKTTVILVDHHVLSERNEYLKPYVSQIFDHRPTDDKIKEYPTNVTVKIEMVGSCATIIAQACEDSIFNPFDVQDSVTGYAEFFEDNQGYAELLHSAIILDTVNFSTVVNKGTPHDERMVEHLEKKMKITDPATYRSTKLSKLTAAKSDVSRLTAAQLLRKDAKIKGAVFMPGFPIPVKTFLQKPNAMKSIADALQVNGCLLCVLLGLKSDTSNPERDMAVFNTKHDPIAKRLSKHIQQWTSPSFQLTPVVIPGIENVDYFKISNISASRKQYIPAIEEFLQLKH